MFQSLGWTFIFVLILLWFLRWNSRPADWKEDLYNNIADVYLFLVSNKVFFPFTIKLFTIRTGYKNVIKVSSIIFIYVDRQSRVTRRLVVEGHDLLTLPYCKVSDKKMDLFSMNVPVRVYIFTLTVLKVHDLSATGIIGSFHVYFLKTSLA